VGPALADSDEVMADPDIDALVVASPARTHAPLVADALVVGKHVPTSCRYPAIEGLPTDGFLAPSDAGRSQGVGS
jgi:myo-inositol 2-dehydrogenase/D-chiro-inositol 1-dehydrogenase